MVELAMTPHDAPDVLIYALGPWIQNAHRPPIFRVRLGDKKFIIENKHGTGTFGRWKTMGHARDFATAVQGMTELNDRELHKHGLSQWPSPGAIADALAKYGIAVA